MNPKSNILNSSQLSLQILQRICFRIISESVLFSKLRFYQNPTCSSCRILLKVLSGFSSESFKTHLGIIPRSKHIVVFQVLILEIFSKFFIEFFNLLQVLLSSFFIELTCYHPYNKIIWTEVQLIRLSRFFTNYSQGSLRALKMFRRILSALPRVLFLFFFSSVIARQNYHADGVNDKRGFFSTVAQNTTTRLLKSHLRFVLRTDFQGFQ